MPKDNEVVLENNLLRKIDRFILKMDAATPASDIEGLIASSLQEFGEDHGFESPGLCLVYTGKQFKDLRCYSKSGLHPSPAIPVIPPLARFTTDKEKSILMEDLSDLEIPGMEQPFKQAILGPIYTPQDVLLCLLILPAKWRGERQHIHEIRLVEAMDALVAQLTIAFRQFEQERFHHQMSELWSRFLDDSLSPSACFDTLAREIPNFFPVFGPLRLDKSVVTTQVLMLPQKQENTIRRHLVIRGTTGLEHNGTRLSIYRSISGILITNPEMSLFCDDPTKRIYRGLYKNYFGTNERVARSELVSRLIWDDETVGLINIESSEEGAFTIHHKKIMIENAITFGHIGKVLEDRILMNTKMQNSVANSTRNYLSAMAGVFKHAIRSPNSAMSINLQIANETIAKLKKSYLRLRDLTVKARTSNSAIEGIERAIDTIEETQELLFEAFERQNSISNDFTNGVAQYAEMGYLDLSEVIVSAIRLAEDNLLVGHKKEIKILFNVAKRPRERLVLCSTLVKQHLFSIFDNAIDAVAARMKSDGHAGVIAVSVEREAIPAGQEKLLNRSWVIRIRDNGAGVPPAQLHELRKFDPGTYFRENGNGHGLVAAQRYVTSINGRVELESEYGRFFEVLMYLEEYREEVHGALSHISSRKLGNG